MLSTSDSDTFLLLSCRETSFFIIAFIIITPPPCLMTRQDKTMQAKTKQGKARQDKARQGKARQDKTRLGGGLDLRLAWLSFAGEGRVRVSVVIHNIGSLPYSVGIHS